MAGELYKALNRNNFLSTAWDNIINTVLGNRLKNLFNKKEPPVLPEQQKQQEQPPVLPTTGAEQGTGQPPILPDAPPPSGQPEEDVPYIPSGEGAGDKTSIPSNSVNPAQLYIPQDKITAPKTPTTKVDTSGLKYTVGSKTADQLANENLTSGLENYLADVSKFGKRGEQFSNLATNVIYPLEYKQGEPPPPKMTGHEFTTDKDGNLLQYVYDPTSHSYFTQPVLDDKGQPVKEKLPEYDKNRIQVTVGDDGNAVLYNMQSGEKINTDMPIDKFDKEFGLETDKFNFDKEYKTALLQLKASKQKSGNGKGNGSTGIMGDIMVLDENNQPVDLTDVESPLGKLVQNLYSGNKKTREQAQSLLKIYAPNFSIVNTKIVSSMEDAIRDVGSKFQKGEISQQQFQDYIKKLETDYPNEVKHLRKKFAK